MHKGVHMEQIERAQTDLCYFLIDMMPAEWDRICFYAECGRNSTAVWFAAQEKTTGAVVTRESFWRRYHSYPVDERTASIGLLDRIEALRQAYLDRFGASKTWCTYSLSISGDGKLKADLGYDPPQGKLAERNRAVYKQFFGMDYQPLEGKYPG